MFKCDKRVLSFKKDNMEKYINFTPMAIDENVNFLLYAEPKLAEPKIKCRIPRCLATLSTSGNQWALERTQHPTISYSCNGFGLYAKNRITIDNHNVRCHRALEAKSNEQFVKYVIFAIHSLNNKYCYLQSL
jgi:hypothetical protein